MKKLVFVLLISVITVNVYASTLQKRYFSSDRHLNFIIPNSDLIIDEAKKSVLTITMHTKVDASNSVKYVIVCVPLDEKHYPHHREYSRDFLNESLKMRMKMSAQSEGRYLENLKCRNVNLNGDTKAYQCTTNMKHSDNSTNMVYIGTLLIKKDQVIHVYGSSPAKSGIDHQGFNKELYNTLIRTIEIR